MTMIQQAAARTCERQAFYDHNVGFNDPAPWKQLRVAVTARPIARHRTFQRYLKTFGLITMVGISATLALPIGKAQARGNFSSTCKNLHLTVVDFSKTATLTADCQREDQKDPKKATHYGASINLNAIITVNQGHLQWARRPGGGDFQQSCSLDGLGFLQPWGSGNGSSVLVALCNGRLQNIDLNENIANINGDLTYIGWEKVIFDNGSPKATPPSVVPPRMKAGNAK